MLSINFVRTYIESFNYKLISEVYTKSTNKLDIECDKGHKYSANFHNFKPPNNRRCPICAKNLKHSYDYVYNYFKERGCELLESEYINAKTKMNYKCSCGNIHSTRFSKFKLGERCNYCSINKRSGKNNYQWKSDRSEIRISKKLRKNRNRKWALKNMKDDPNYELFLLKPDNFQTDHIIPISIFTKFIIEYNLDAELIRNIVNKKDNLQLLTIEENKKKLANGSIFEAAQFLMLNGIQLSKRI